MADLISRAAALDAIDGIKPVQGNMKQLAMKALCWAAVKIIQPVDAVPVVRCSECKYSDTIYDTATYAMPLKCLNIRYGGVMPDWYCEHGERKEDADA